MSVNSRDHVWDRSVVPALKVDPSVIGDAPYVWATSVADMDFAVAPAISEAIAERLKHPIFGYETVPTELIPAVINWSNSRYHWNPPRDSILRAPNALTALALGLSALTQVGDAVVVLSPVFYDFYDVIRENNRQVREVELSLEHGRYSIPWKTLERTFHDKDVTCVILCNPHNPIGRVWTREELMKLILLCTKYGVKVLSDDLHSDIVFSPAKYVPIASLGAQAADISVTIWSPAKSFNIASCCMAFAVIPNLKLQARFRREGSRWTVNKNNTFANFAVVAAYSQGTPWLKDTLDYLHSNVAMLRSAVETMEGISMVIPEGTFLVWLDCRDLGLDPDDLYALFRNKAGWAVSRGTKYGTGGEGFVRVNIASPRSVIEKAIESLSSVLNNRTNESDHYVYG